MNKLGLLAYPLILLIYSIYSYSQVTPNLVLSSNPHFWQFQQAMWQLGYHQRPVSTFFFACLILASFAVYAHILANIKSGRMNKKLLVIQLALCMLSLLPSYPALSNDVFNYLMNAKMMQVYHASPYTHAAWDFPQEPWLSFMMNIHTTTPYGYVWTVLGYLTYMLALGDLQAGMLAFRLLAIASVGVIAWSIGEITKKNQLYLVGFFVFNPLIMFEAVNNTHNDITMMAFLILGIALSARLKHQSRLPALVALAVGWLLSVYTKLVTVILPGVVAFYWIVRRRLPGFNAADYGVWLLILAMFADGSKRFFSWYILWAFCLTPLARSPFTRHLALLFTFTALMSYVFFLYTGEYTSQMIAMRIGLLFSLPLLYLIYTCLGQVRLAFFANREQAT